MDAFQLLSVLVTLLLGNTEKLNPNDLGLDTHPRLWVHHTFKFTSPTLNPVLPCQTLSGTESQSDYSASAAFPAPGLFCAPR